VIVDTSFLVDVLRNKSPAVKKMLDYERKGVPLSMTTISVFELWHGKPDLIDAQKKQRMNALLEALTVYALDTESAKIAGQLKERLRSGGQDIESEDCLIAGICLQHNQPLLTRNIKHFSRIIELQVEGY